MDHMKHELLEDEKLKAIEALLGKMNAMIAEGRGDNALAKDEMKAETALDEMKEGQEEEKELLAEDDEEGGEEVEEMAGEEMEKEPSLQDMIRDYMAGEKKGLPTGKAATIVVAQTKLKPKKVMKLK